MNQMHLFNKSDWFFDRIAWLMGTSFFARIFRSFQEIQGILDLPRVSTHYPLVTFKDGFAKIQTKNFKTQVPVRLFESIHVKVSG